MKKNYKFLIKEKINFFLKSTKCGRTQGSGVNKKSTFYI